MKNFLEKTDLFFTIEGDLSLSSRGSLNDTRISKHRDQIQRIMKRIGSTKGDWSLQDDIGVNLGDFVGLPNTRENGLAIRNRVYAEIIKEGNFRAENVDVQVFPTSENSVGLIISVNPPGSTDVIRLSFSYDMRDNKLIPRNI